MSSDAVRYALCQLLATGVVLAGSASAQPIRPERQALEFAPRELVDRLWADPIAYFRFVNRPWIAHVCDVFAGEVHGLPLVRLHGDAHVEQFAVTSEAWGLDDFDDSTRGPALVDIVGHLRSRAARSRAEFLARGNAQMKPMVEASTRAVIAGMAAVSAAVDDDELVEAKQLRDLSGLRCLDTPTGDQSAVRVILGVRQIGRLQPDILLAGPTTFVPEVVVLGRQLRDWWLRSWDPSYRELSIDDLRSARDLAAIVYDAGAQLGAGSLREDGGSPGFTRRQDLATVARLESRIRDEASRFVDRVLVGWKELRAR